MLSLVVVRAQDVERLADFYATLGLCFVKHRHGNGPEHVSATMGETVFEIYPASGSAESTASTRLGFTVPSLADVVDQLRKLNVTILSEPSDTPFGRRAVVQDFEGHKVEIYERVPKFQLLNVKTRPQRL
jgi:catechol 2,3-dioxygenase-like lactoylglutathione lyase family enzyme